MASGTKSQSKPANPYPEQLPEVTTVGLVAVGARWQVVRVVTQGDRVVSSELLGRPAWRALAHRELALAQVQSWPAFYGRRAPEPKP